MGCPCNSTTSDCNCMADETTAAAPSNPPDWLTEFGKQLATTGLDIAKKSLETSDDKANLGADQKAAEVKGDLSKVNIWVMAGVGLGAAVLVYLLVKK